MFNPPPTHGISDSPQQTLSRVLRALGYRKLSARPRHHAQDPDAIPAFKKPSPPAWRRSRRPSAVSR
ncbi:helix-turn-helix domain-containing protein [Methylobacterium mesophilicum]